MTASSTAPHQVLVVEPDSRVRRALVDLVRSTEDLAVLAACATVEQADTVGRTGTAAVALVGIRPPDSTAIFAAITRLAGWVPVVAVASLGSAATRAISAGATAFCDEDGDADALVAALRAASTRRRPRGGTPTEPGSAG